MISNFDFLKNKDKKLFSIIEDAERLYRDGYFEQTIAQTRKFAEYICKKTLGVRRTTEETFDEMLGTLKDILGNSPSDKEFIDDMYFLKKQGNLAVHGGAVTEMGGTAALECLQRAFEVSINYAIKCGFANKKILNSHYSIDTLMTGKTPKLSEKYQKAKEEMLKEGVKELADFAAEKKKPEQKPKKKPKKTENKVIEADFKAKKKKPQKQTKKEPETKESNFMYAACIGVLFVLGTGVLLFIFPIF